MTRINIDDDMIERALAACPVPPHREVMEHVLRAALNRRTGPKDRRVEDDDVMPISRPTRRLVRHGRRDGDTAWTDLPRKSDRLKREAEERAHPCGDMECNKDREKKMVRVGTYDSKPVFCDPCLVPIVKALNDGGIRTIASCCGHNRRPATLAIEGDRWLTLTNRRGMEQIAAIFPDDINKDDVSTVRGV